MSVGILLECNVGCPFPGNIVLTSLNRPPYGRLKSSGGNWKNLCNVLRFGVQTIQRVRSLPRAPDLKVVVAGAVAFSGNGNGRGNGNGNGVVVAVVVVAMVAVGVMVIVIIPM